MQAPDQSPRQFEAVLSRLDALMKRSQVDAPMDALPPPAAEALQQPSVLQSAPQAQPDTIPLLTERYEEPPSADADVAERSSRQGMAQLVVEALMPELCASLNRVVEEETRLLRERVLVRLQAETAAALQQRLLRDD